LREHRWLVLAVLGIAQLMVVLDGTIVNIALPSAQAALHFSDADRQWVVTAYALGFGSLLLLGGRLADIFGRRRLFLIGLAGFASASAVGGAAVDLTMLLGARAVQGVFAALLAPALLSLLSTTFTEPRERGRAFGIFGAISGAGAAVGLLLGGVLTEYLSWRWCLYVNLVLAAVTFTGGYLWLDRAMPPRSERAQIDAPGTVTVTGGLFLVVFGFAHAETAGWGDVATVTYLVLGAASIAVFLRLQARGRHPLLPLRVLADRNRAGAYTATFTVGMALFGVLLFLTYYMQVILGLTAVRAGLAFLPMSAVIITASAVGSTVFAPRVSPKIMIPLGLGIAACGMLLFTRITVPGSYYVHVLPASLVFGAGLGTVFAFASNTATRTVRSEDSGVASAMVSVAQQVGAAIGTALLNTIAASATSHYLRRRNTGSASHFHAEAAVHGYIVGFLAGAVILIVGAAVSASLLRRGVPSAYLEA
jgi:EmrB/QacA subfamily drug resistance transporter